MPSVLTEKRRKLGMRNVECGVGNGSFRTNGTPNSELRTPNSPTDVRLLKRVAKSHNLTEENWKQILKVLGRLPTLTEVGIFGVMFSEHCSYCSSKPYLKTFPTKGARILVPAGKENAGVVDVGDGLAVAFKCESHNHPSAVEPVQGAATGVGGIIRDIFTMGARPIALFDSLRFGPLDSDARTTFLFEGVVKGISDYGNSVGVPTIGGEIYFDFSYRGNPLVNVMCIGLLSKNQLARGAAHGVGNPVIYVGSSTGRDGLGGASFASRDLAEGDADRPAVQIGDPFTEKCLIEATLEALATGDVIGIQDMGAAGLTCSTCEMPSRGGTGIEIDVALVPRREKGMTPYEIMLSESQERMLLVAKKGREGAIEKIFAKWGLNAVEIGRVTADGRMRVKNGGAVVADIPVKALTSEAPVYHRPIRRPRYLSKVQQLPLKRLPQPKDFNATLLTLLASPTIANKAYVFEQYDHMVQTNTAVLPGRADAAVLRLPAPATMSGGPGKGSAAFLAATIDGNGRYCYLDPYEGGKAVVAEAARNLVCVGAKPLAITDCLNFGSPMDPEIMWQFKECVRGIGDACRAFDTPVTGGNVSLYNQGARARPGNGKRRAGGAIDPTPIVGMIGIIEPVSPQPITANFKESGDVILLLGETREELGGSEYLLTIHRKKAGRPPRIDLQQERALQQVMLGAARQGWLKSAHDCSEGGLAVALAECCIMDEQHLIGATVQFGVRCSVFGSRSTTNYERHATNIRADALLFGESAGRIVVSCERRFIEPLLALAKKHGVPAAEVGTVGGTRLAIGSWIDVPAEDLNDAWRSGLARHLQA